MGFYGVVDERMDLELLDAIAAGNPEVSFVVIGPVVKISEDDLPKHDNLYYLGSKDYQDLPAYLKGFDIAMMPFALNEATEFISPTKTLEFMAAKKPIISTPVRDVAEIYPNEVSIPKTAGEFSTAINTYLHESTTARRKREVLQLQVIEKTSWDNTVRQMSKLMKLEASDRRAHTPAPAILHAPALSYSI